MSSVSALYLVLLAGVAGYVLIARVPSILHTPMMSGSNFIHGIVLAGTMLALGSADTDLERLIGFVAVMAAAANVVGGFIVTDRMLALFDQSSNRKGNYAGMDPLSSADGDRKNSSGAASGPASQDGQS